MTYTPAAHYIDRNFRPFWKTTRLTNVRLGPALCVDGKSDPKRKATIFSNNFTNKISVLGRSKPNY